MTEPPQKERIAAYVDDISNYPKNDETRAAVRERLLKAFEARVDKSVERVWDLPSVLLQRPTDPYVTLLVEARNLYVLGFFYSCVAMCGIVGERLVKDVVRRSVHIERDGAVQRPADSAFDQLEHVEIYALTNFLSKAELLSKEATKAVKDLGVLRNAYAHARGSGSAQADAIKAIELLQTLVEDTVSVFKDFGITADGSLVKKPRPSQS